MLHSNKIKNGVKTVCSQLSTRSSKTVQVYLFGLAAVAAATTLRLLAQPILGNTAPYVLYILPIMAAAAYGGFAPGLFATVSSALVIVFVFLGGPVIVFPYAPYLFFFLLDGLCISWLGEQMCLAMRGAAKADSEAAAARERERTILNSVSDAFGSVDEHWQFVHANENLATLTGRPLGDLLGKPVWEVWPELAEAPARQELNRAFQDRVPVRVEVFVPRLGHWYETSAYPQARGLSLFSHDITDRKLAEHALRESEERLRLAPEAARIGTWTYDVADKRIVWSPGLEQIFGLAPGSFAGTEDALFELIHPEDRVNVRNAVARVVEQRSQYEMEFRYRHASGESRWMLGRGKLYPDSCGSPCRIVGIGMDITDQKRSDEKLRHTQKLESLGVLAGGIAHDFNNLLVAIMGNASLASESLPGDPAVRNQLQQIVGASQKAAHLTRQMLAYAGKGRFIIERLQVTELVRDTESLLRSSILKNVDLRLDLSADLLCVEADVGQMQQLIMNLVINAAEAIPEGQPGVALVRTSLQRVNKSFISTQLAGQGITPGNYVALEVHDTGIGMDEATQAKILEPFFTTKFVGRGLGLSAVSGIVRSHKGALTVTSSPGKGSTFRVLLPAVSECRTEPQPGAAETNLRCDGSCVLVVDDESCVRKLAEAVLHKYGYTVLVAEDGLAAIELLRRTSQRVALVLLDLSMPGMSAQQVIQHIQSVWPGTRIVLSSGYGEEEVLARFTGTKIAGFVQKPYTPAQLAEKIKRAMGAAELSDRNPIPSAQCSTKSHPKEALTVCSISHSAA